MKTYILRSPETDRKGVNIPNLLNDLDDYGDSNAHGTAEAGEGVVTPGAATAAISLGTTSELYNVVAGGSGLSPGVDGMYMLMFGVQWSTPLFGPHAGTVAPQPTLRLVEVWLNGAYLASASISAFVDGNDSGSLMARLTAGDILEVYAANNDGAGTGTYASARLQIAKIAP